MTTIASKSGPRPARASGGISIRKCLTALLLFGLFLASSAFAQERELPQQIRFLEARALALKHDIAEREDQRKILYTQVRKLAAEIEQIKNQPQPSFLDRRRLEGLSADAQEAGAKLEALVAEITKKQTEYDASVQAVYTAYTKEMERVSDQISTEKSRSDIVALTKHFLWLRDRREQYRPKGVSVAAEDFLSVEIQPDETRSSLLAKQDLLRKRVARVSAIIANLEKEIKGLKKERALSDQMESMVKEYSLFDDGVVFSRTPRAYTKEEPGATPAPSEPFTESKTDVRVFPLDQEARDHGIESIMYSIDEEIRRLEGLIQYMRQVNKKLSDQLSDLQERLKKMPVSSNPAAVRSALSPTEIGSKEGLS